MPEMLAYDILWRSLMRYPLVITAIAALISSAPVQMATAQELRIPGLVEYLYHNFNMRVLGGVAGQYRVLRGVGSNGQPLDVRYPAAPPPGSVAWSGGDLGGPSGSGFKWFAVADAGQQDPAQYRSLPPGIVLALKHSRNQVNSGIVAFGRYDPVSGPSALDGFEKRAGGDLGAPAGVGFFWYESTDTGDTDWSLIDRLPSGTVVGLRHTKNVKWASPPFVWQGTYTCKLRTPGNPPSACDPRDPLILPPNGFARMVGGDLGAPSGHGFVWYQKL